MKSKNWKWISVVGSLLVATGLKSGMNKAYYKVTGKNPPVNPAEKGTGFKDALIWTIIISIAGGLGKLLFDSLIAHKWQDSAATPKELVEAAKSSAKEPATA